MSVTFQGVPLQPGDELVDSDGDTALLVIDNQGRMTVTYPYVSDAGSWTLKDGSELYDGADGGPYEDSFGFVAHRPLSRGFGLADSGARVEFPSGMHRDTDEGKPRFDLIPLPMLRRWADHMAKGAVKYGDRNWELADSQAEVDRMKASAFRHFVQWLEGSTDEDHAAAVMFNVAAAETTAAKL